MRHGERDLGNETRGTGPGERDLGNPGNPGNRGTRPGEPGNGTWGMGHEEPENVTRKTKEWDRENRTKGTGPGEWGTGKGDLGKESNDYCLLKNYQIIKN